MCEVRGGWPCMALGLWGDLVNLVVSARPGMKHMKQA